MVVTESSTISPSRDRTDQRRITLPRKLQRVPDDSIHGEVTGGAVVAPILSSNRQSEFARLRQNPLAADREQKFDERASPRNPGHLRLPSLIAPRRLYRLSQVARAQ